MVGRKFVRWEVKQGVNVVCTSLSRVFSTSVSVSLAIFGGGLEGFGKSVDGESV